MLDVDGTLAPIVRRPDEAAVPEEARRELERLVARYALVACVSGRTGEDARRLVGVDGVRYVGSHGLELAPEADRWRDEIQRFAASVDWPVEDKGLTVSFHYREAENEDDALEYLEGVAERARAAGLVPRFGRKVLELRPPVEADKGTAVTQLLGEAGLRPGALCGRRHDRHRRLPRARRPRAGDPDRGLVGRGAERARERGRHRRRLARRAPHPAGALLSTS